MNFKVFAGFIVCRVRLNSTFYGLSVGTQAQTVYWAEQLVYDSVFFPIIDLKDTILLFLLNIVVSMNCGSSFLIEIDWI